MVMADIDFWRQMDIISPALAEDTKVTIIGAGGIGSPTIMALSKMGIGKMKIFDPDTVENHNIPNQMFMPKNIGQNKADIMAEFAQELGVAAESFPERYVDQNLEGIVIVAVDSMAIRAAIWNRAKLSTKIDLFIEARMGAEIGAIFAVYPGNMMDVEYYESWLYTDEEAVEGACTARAIIYNTFGTAAFIGSIVSKYIMRKPFPRSIKYDYVNHLVVTSDNR